MDRARRLILPALLCLPSLVEAQCRIAGCQTPPPRVAAPDLPPGPVELGDTLPRDTYETVWEIEYYGLDSPDGRWVYMRVEDDLYRVDWSTMEVLERVTTRMRRRFPDVAARHYVEPRVVDRFADR